MIKNMSFENFPRVHTQLRRNVEEVPLFEADSKDSGYCEDLSVRNDTVINSSLYFEDEEATILCFSPTGAIPQTTPAKRLFGGGKRLFESPTLVAATSLKRLRIFDIQTEGDGIRHSDNEGFEIPQSRFESLLCPIESQKEVVKEAVEKSYSEELIGDFSKNHALPLIEGRHADLRSISANTMKDVLDGKFDTVLQSVTVVDCRYPYEYHGGHIKSAVNIYNIEQCMEFLSHPVKPANERHIIIFHCEFSIERGPNMIRTLRKEDRVRNSIKYPALNYPEIYILEGGYKNFFELYPAYCDPLSYTQMMCPNHIDEMRFYRKKDQTIDNISKTSKKKSAVSRGSRLLRKTLSANFFTE